MPKKRKHSVVEGRLRRKNEAKRRKQDRQQPSNTGDNVLDDNDRDDGIQPSNTGGRDDGIQPNTGGNELHDNEMVDVIQPVNINQSNANQYIGRRPNPTVPRFSIGLADQICQYCSATRFHGEKLNCCHNGKVFLPQLFPYPDELRELLIGNDEKSKNFQDNIRQYNSAMAFASFGANITSHVGRGPYSFRIHGQIYVERCILLLGKNQYIVSCISSKVPKLQSHG